jgi:hypothetical protein
METLPEKVLQQTKIRTKILLDEKSANLVQIYIKVCGFSLARSIVFAT